MVQKKAGEWPNGRMLWIVDLTDSISRIQLPNSDDVTSSSAAVTREPWVQLVGDTMVTSQLTRLASVGIL